MRSFTSELAKFVEATEYDTLPKQVILETKKRILDQVGIALSGFNLESGKRI